MIDWVACVPLEFEQEILFSQGRQQRFAHLRFGWFEVRLPETPQTLWVVLAADVDRQHDLTLLTTAPLHDPGTVRQVYGDWRPHCYSEHGYRVDQEVGLECGR